jgi:hypothetical protein
VVLVTAVSCRPKGPEEGRNDVRQIEGGTVNTLSPLADVLARNTASLMTIEGVTGTGEGRRGDRPVFVVYVSHVTKEDRTRIPREVEGYPVEIRDVGDVTAPPR